MTVSTPGPGCRERSPLGDQLAAHLEGSAAIPRKNGELVFQAPWESRAFGMAVALCEQGLYNWDEFRARLIAEIAAWEREHPLDAEYCYYQRWLAALQKLLVDKGLCAAQEIETRMTEVEEG